MNHTMMMYPLSTINERRIVGSMSTTDLATLIQGHIDRHYGGNQAAFARAVDVKPQTLNTLLKGKTTLPQADVRRRLAKELGIPHVQFFVMAGEIGPEELEDAGVRGVISDRPVDYVHRAVDAYDWSMHDAAIIIDMMDVFMAERDEPVVTRGPMRFRSENERDRDAQ